MRRCSILRAFADRTAPAAGLVAAVALLGDALATAFPIGPGDVNELTDSVRVD